MKIRRNLTPFSLAFLDIMFCGFGAVVLLVMILNGEVLRKREARAEDLRGELSRATALEQLARSNLEDVRRKITAVELEEGDLAGRIQEVRRKIEGVGRDLTAAQRRSRELAAAAARAKEEQEALRRVTAILKQQRSEQPRPGDRLAGFTGDGERQYLTGLKLGGKRTLILVDASASMLDETVVNIVRRKLMDAPARRIAPKWQRALRTTHWLIANLRRDTLFQVYAFDTTARPVVKGTERRWLSAGKVADIDAALAGIRAIAPEGGTSLHVAFRIAGQLEPRPDSIILLTDGLPTQGSSATSPRLVTSEERLAHFENALGLLPKAVPVNTLLFPIEGDPLAAVSFWQLAISTRGSFITPSRDWP